MSLYILSSLPLPLPRRSCREHIIPLASTRPKGFARLLRRTFNPALSRTTEPVTRVSHSEDRLNLLAQDPFCENKDTSDSGRLDDERTGHRQRCFSGRDGNTLRDYYCKQEKGRKRELNSDGGTFKGILNEPTRAPGSIHRLNRRLRKIPPARLLFAQLPPITRVSRTA